MLGGRLKKSMGPPKYFFRVHLVGRFVPLVGVISRPVESPLKSGKTWYKQDWSSLNHQSLKGVVVEVSIGTIISSYSKVVLSSCDHVH